MNHCGLINGLIGLQAIAVFTDIVSLTMKIAPSWWLGGWAVGWKASGGWVAGGGWGYSSLTLNVRGKKVEVGRALI